MGLDVYLYRYEDKAAHDALTSKVEKLTEAVWSGDSEGSQKSAQCEVIEIEHGYIKEPDSMFLHPPGESKVEEPSAKHPDHYFKIGYMRSSYNDSGINRVLSDNCGGRDLYYIFAPEERYEFQPDWNAARERCLELSEQLKAARPVRVSKSSHNPFTNPSELPASTEEALALFAKTANTDHGDGGFSNRDGEFFLKEPLRVLAILPGTEKAMFGLSAGKSGCHFIVYESSLEWHQQAMEVVLETIDFVLSQPDPEKYWLHWSS